MIAGAGSGLSRGERIQLAAIVTLPFALYVLLAAFGYVKYLQLAALGGTAMAVATALFLRPRDALWILLAYVYIGPGVPFAAAAGPLAFLVLAAVLFGMLRGEPNRLTDAMFWYANGFLMLISIGSIVFAQSASVAVEELGRYAKILLVAYLIVQLVRTPADLRRMMTVVFVGAVLTVLVGGANLLLGIQQPNVSFVAGEQAASYMLRFTGAHANPNLAAAVMCSALPLGIFGFKHARPRWRFVYLAGIIIVIVGMFATFSRSVIFPFSFVTAAVLVREARSRRAHIGITVLIALGLVLAPHSYWERVIGLRDAFETTTLDWSVYLRLLALNTAWDLFLSHPFTGVGIGNFIVVSAYQLFVRIPVHNTYLEILVGVGVFGLLAFLFVLASGLRHSVAGIRYRWVRHPAWMQSASFYWAASGISICISALFGNLPFRYFLWVPVAAGLVIGNLLREEKNTAR